MAKNRIPTWALLILFGVGLLIVGIPGLFVYMKVTATKVHRDSRRIPSVMESPPLAKWAGTAEQARQIVRTSISENNMAGLSIAVGIDGEIVWTEGIVLTSAAIGLLLDEGRLTLDAASDSFDITDPQRTRASHRVFSVDRRAADTDEAV